MKGKKHWKQVLAVALSAALLFGNLWLSDGMSQVAAAEITGTERSCAHHIHDEECGYDEETSIECTYVCPVCEVQALIDALPETDGITKENAEEVTRQINAVLEAVKTLDEEQAVMLSMERCTAAADAVSALNTSESQDEKETDTEESIDTAKLQSCPHHTHDEACGYDVQTREGCTYECLICKVQALIDALPAAEEISEENAQTVETQLDAIDEAKLVLTDEQMDELNIEKYIAAAQALGEAYDAQPLDGETTVAKIGNEEYTTIAAAIEAVSEGTPATIEMIASTEENVVIPEGKNITLNLADGVTLTNNAAATKAHTILNNGILTINGSGTIDNVSHGKGAVYNNAGATATLNGCTYTRSMENGQSAENNGGNSWYTIKNFGTMTINEGVIVEQNNGKYSSLLANGWQNYAAANTGSGEPKPAAEASLTINGGTFSGGLNTIKNDDYAILVINDGNFVNVAQHAVMNWNVATINGGTFETQGDGSKAAVWCGYDNDTYNKGTLTITGGTFTAANNAASVEKGYPGATVTVTGGTYSSDVSAFVPDGYAAVGSNGSVTVGKATEQTEEHVAVVNGQYFTNLQTAIEVAQSSDTITLLKDTSIDSTIIRKAIDLDLGGNTLQIASDATAFYGLAVLADMTIRNGSIVDLRTATYSASSIGNRVIQIQDCNFITENLKISFYRSEVVNNTWYNYGIYILDSSGADHPDVVLGAGTEIKENAIPGYAYSEEGYGIGVAVIASDGTEGENNTALEINGATIETTGFAVSGNGTAHGTSITINDGSTVVSTKSTAIYHPQKGVLNINGGYIEGGETGIEIRAGELNVKDGQIVGKGTPTDVQPNGNGTTSMGAGIAVAQHTTKLPISVNITGGKIEGYSAVYESNPQKNSGEDLEKINLTISDGTFVAINGGTNAVYSEDIGDFVSGGEFSSNFDDKYLAPTVNTVIKRNGNMEAPYVVGKTADKILENAQSGDVITLYKVSGDVNVPEGVIIENETGNAIVVNGEILENGSKITSAHKLVKHNAKPATCTEDGNSEYYECSLCGKYFADENGTKEIQKDSWIIKASHTYGEWKVTKAATETAKGEKQRACSVCGAVEKAEIPALGHSHGYGSDWEWDSKNHWHECGCGEKADISAHTYDEWTVTKEPTAEAAGIRETRCTVCGFRVGEPIPATGSGAAASANVARTGDSSNAAVWMTLLVLAGGVLIISRKKYHR